MSTVFMLCERALAHLRANRLSLSTAETSLLEALNCDGLIAAHAQEEAVSCARHFAEVRDQLLQAYPWVFARKSAKPARLTDPIPGWRFAFGLPGDCLKLLTVLEGPPPPEDGYKRHGGTGYAALPHWEIVGNALLCNHNPVQIRYTARITDTAQWTQCPDFEAAFCAALAGAMAAAVTGEMSAFQLMDAKVNAAVARALKNGSILRESGLPVITPLYLDYLGAADAFDDGAAYGRYGA
jgi:hypothetical protein